MSASKTDWHTTQQTTEMKTDRPVSSAVCVCLLTNKCMWQQMGLDCFHWEPPIYHDLLRQGDGSPETLLTTYFNTVLLQLK